MEKKRMCCHKVYSQTPVKGLRAQGIKIKASCTKGRRIRLNQGQLYKRKKNILGKQEIKNMRKEEIGDQTIKQIRKKHQEKNMGKK